MDLIKAAAKDHKLARAARPVPIAPYPGRQHAKEFSTVTAALHRAPKAAGLQIAVRKFDPNTEGVRLTFRVEAAK